MKIHGKDIPVRGSNKRYTQLDDLDWLYEQLQEMSMAELADKMGIEYKSRNVIRHRVEKYFPLEWKLNIVRERKQHKKVKKSTI